VNIQAINSDISQPDKGQWAQHDTVMFIAAQEYRLDCFTTKTTVCR